MGVRVAWIVLLFALFASPAHASEAPEASTPAVSQPAVPKLDAVAFRRTRTMYWVGLGFGLAGPPLAVAGFSIFVNECFFECDEAPTEGVAMTLFGIAATATGLSLVYTAAWSNANTVRAGGIRVSTALAIAGAVVPFACYGLAAVATAASMPTVGAGFAIASFVTPFVFTGAQLAHTASRLRSPDARTSAGVMLSPTRIGRSPGVAVALRW